MGAASELYRNTTQMWHKNTKTQKKHEKTPQTPAHTNAHKKQQQAPQKTRQWPASQAVHSTTTLSLLIDTHKAAPPTHKITDGQHSTKREGKLRRQHTKSQADNTAGRQRGKFGTSNARIHKWRRNISLDGEQKYREMRRKRGN
jgi:hypothetical protein